MHKLSKFGTARPSATGLCLHLELLKLNVKTASQHLKVLITLIQTAQSSPQNRWLCPSVYFPLLHWFPAFLELVRNTSKTADVNYEGKSPAHITGLWRAWQPGRNRHPHTVQSMQSVLSTVHRLCPPEIRFKTGCIWMLVFSISDINNVIIFSKIYFHTCLKFVIIFPKFYHYLSKDIWFHCLINNGLIPLNI